MHVRIVADTQPTHRSLCEHNGLRHFNGALEFRMAIVDLKELRDFLRGSSNWDEQGLQQPDILIGIELEKGIPDGLEPGPTSAPRTVTYEGRNATLVLDFDARDFLVAIELV
jgi:hypothetical protein